MKKIQKIIIILTIVILSSCNNSSKKKMRVSEKDSIISNSISISNQISSSSSNSELEEDNDTITTIKFNELSLSINRLIIYDENNKLSQIQKDTVEIYAELGETIEGQIITLSSDQITDLKIEQRYETSVTIMNEGPHCDLTDCEHYYSEWKQLPKNSKAQFTCDKYSEKEMDKFPKIAIKDLKQKVKDQCGVEWLNLIKDVKIPTEYPSGVSISRYFLKVTGYRKDNGQIITKTVIIEIPMGC